MPGRAAIQSFLRRARHARCGYALIEATSQGVVQHRHRFVNWNIGVLTNLHPEHIESHGSFEKYRAAKLSFLKYVLKKHGKVFLNRDDTEFDFFSGELARGNEETIEYSRGNEQLQSQLARVERALDREEVAAPKFLLSDFNRENIAAAVAIAKDLGITDRIIDYAHTPDSLEAAYRAAREQLPDPSSRLICVLGAAGGGRDRWKRPEMGKIATHYCDEIILTDEDPYDEDPRAIVGEVAAGIAQMPYPKPEVTNILDRREALARAVDIMGEGDIVIATGKGSEEWIHLAGKKKMPWNEKAIVQELLVAKKKR